MVEIPLKDPDCVGVIISTRPDCLNPALLSSLAGLILQYDKKCLFELGVQSAHEKSLVLLNRNHTFFDFLESGLAIRAFGCFELSAHLIFGIPGETTREMITTLEQVCSFGVDALKLHHLQVIRDTELEKEFDLGNVKLFTLDDYLDFLVQALAIIPADVTIHRLWTTSSPHLLVAPKWNILASDLSKTLLTKMKREGIYQGMACSTP